MERLVAYRKADSVSDADLIEYLKGHTNAEAAAHFGVHVRTVARWRRERGIGRDTVLYGGRPSFTALQTKLLAASLLGDGCIGRDSRRFSVGQKACRREYVLYLFDSLRPFSSHLYEAKAKYPSWRMYTHASDLFEELRGRWYRGAQKVVPEDLRLDAELVAHWYVQDGSNHPADRSVRFATHCFTPDNVRFLIDVMRRDLGVAASLNFAKGRPTIACGTVEYERLIEMVRPHVPWPCFAYKVDAAGAPRRGELGAAGVKKLDRPKAEAIRAAFRSGRKVAALAAEYGVTLKSVYNVVNGLTYKSGVAARDTSDVSVVYNPDRGCVLAASLAATP